MKRLSIILPLAFGLSSISALAQETSEVLDAVRVEDEAESEGTVISEGRLEQNQARDLEDTFRETPEVVVGGSTRTAQKLYLRGLEDTNLNVTVDGARQSGYLFHHQGRLNIDTELLKKVELDAGSGGALSGPGALGGAIRFVTKDAEDLLLPGQNYGALVKGKYATNNDQKGATVAAFTKPSKSLSTLAYVTLSEENNQRAGGGQTIPYTSGRPKASLAKVTARPADGHKLTLSSNYTEDNAQRLVRANFGYTEIAPVTDKVLETLNTTLNYEVKPGSDRLDLTATLYNANSKMQNTSAAINAAPTSTAAIMDSQGLTIANKFR
ncbi:MAG: TonB-dependent receptor, partial [Proteobacteria bacterium]